MIRCLTSMALVIGAFLTTLSAAPTDAAAKLVCPRIYLPVCALKRDGTRDTFPNACEARRARAKILHPGKCEGGPICPFIYLPVCAIDPATGKPRTYPNLCVAESDNARWIRNGDCDAPKK